MGRPVICFGGDDDATDTAKHRAMPASSLQQQYNEYLHYRPYPPASQTTTAAGLMADMLGRRPLFTGPNANVGPASTTTNASAAAQQNASSMRAARAASWAATRAAVATRTSSVAPREPAISRQTDSEMAASGIEAGVPNAPGPSESLADTAATPAAATGPSASSSSRSLSAFSSLTAPHTYLPSGGYRGTAPAPAAAGVSGHIERARAHAEQALLTYNGSGAAASGSPTHILVSLQDSATDHTMMDNATSNTSQSSLASSFLYPQYPDTSDDLSDILSQASSSPGPVQPLATPSFVANTSAPTVRPTYSAVAASRSALVDALRPAGMGGMTIDAQVEAGWPGSDSCPPWVHPRRWLLYVQEQEAAASQENAAYAARLGRPLASPGHNTSASSSHGTHFSPQNYITRLHNDYNGSGSMQVDSERASQRSSNTNVSVDDLGDLIIRHLRPRAFNLLFGTASGNRIGRYYGPYGHPDDDMGSGTGGLGLNSSSVGLGNSSDLLDLDTTSSIEGVMERLRRQLRNSSTQLQQQQDSEDRPHRRRSSALYGDRAGTSTGLASHRETSAAALRASAIGLQRELRRAPPVETGPFGRAPASEQTDSGSNAASPPPAMPGSVTSLRSVPSMGGSTGTRTAPETFAPDSMAYLDAYVAREGSSYRPQRPPQLPPRPPPSLPQQQPLSIRYVPRVLPQTSEPTNVLADTFHRWSMIRRNHAASASASASATALSPVPRVSQLRLDQGQPTQPGGSVRQTVIQMEAMPRDSAVDMIAGQHNGNAEDADTEEGSEGRSQLSLTLH
ncbi:hypothetical protein BC831DRAFT_437569 [Entophlyctis helioformis]|nr:hypothetical protein BC831DRAFT_437569 [Entophlyctis helioformis]